MTEIKTLNDLGSDAGLGAAPTEDDAMNSFVAYIRRLDGTTEKEIELPEGAMEMFCDGYWKGYEAALKAANAPAKGPASAGPALAPGSARPNMGEQMVELILHKDGAYNIYGTIADGPHFEIALTLEQLTEVIGQEFGAAGLRELPQRLERAHRTGCSSMRGETLEDCIACNRAGANETTLTVDEFIGRYLTMPPNAKIEGRD